MNRAYFALSPIHSQIWIALIIINAIHICEWIAESAKYSMRDSLKKLKNNSLVLLLSVHQNSQYAIPTRTSFPLTALNYELAVCTIIRPQGWFWGQRPNEGAVTSRSGPKPLWSLGTLALWVDSVGAVGARGARVSWWSLSRLPYTSTPYTRLLQHRYDFSAAIASRWTPTRLVDASRPVPFRSQPRGWNEAGSGAESAHSGRCLLWVQRG